MPALLILAGSLSAAARRTTPAASAAGADFFLADCCSQIRGDDGARASGADADVGGRRRGEVRGRRLSAGLLRAAAGGLYAVLSLPNFRLPRSWTLSLSAAARRTTPAASAAGADFFLADCCSQIRGDDGARASGADADVGGRRRDEVRGRRLIAGLLRGAAGGLYAVLSLPNFRLPRSWTLSLSVAARRTTPAASAAGADFFLADCCSQIRGDDGARASGADADVGGRRRDEVRGRRLIAGLLRGAAGGSTPCSLSRISGGRARGLYPLARPRAERHLLPLLRAPISF